MPARNLTLVALAALLAAATASVRQCAARPDPGNCLALFRRYYWDSVSGDCKRFDYGGCGGVVPFKSLAECKKAKCNDRRCALKGRMGPCEAAVTKYQYNAKTQKCEPFIWGGCDGLVPFHTQAACKRSCAPAPACAAKPDPGPCVAYFPKYFYDAKTQMCKRFIYGGCQGTVPFDSLQSCVSACPARDPCKLAGETGPCRAGFKRYQFDAKSRSCRSFVWGGCAGVVPFSTRRECVGMCPVDRCRLKHDAGPCKKRVHRFYYDAGSRACKRFVYGGCGGVVPFLTLAECEGECEA